MDDKLPAPDSPTSSDADTSFTIDNYEQGREWIRNSNPQGVTSQPSGVDVEKAEHDFSELNRQFSSISQQAHRLSKHASRASKPADVEKSGTSTDSEEPWDLETALRGNQTAERDAGIKNKQIGTSFDYMW
jgi:hypothetical protein